MSESSRLRLGVNIDHVATLRNARGGAHPCPVAAALLALQAGADGITAHLREDRRHIRDRVLPNAVCLVPEKRTEVTTEGGLDVVNHVEYLKQYVAPFKKAGIRVSLFIDPSKPQIEAAQAVGADIVELHTGRYCETAPQSAERMKELSFLLFSAQEAVALGLECHAGHGLSFDTVKPIAAISQMMELNIGHFLIGEAVFLGLQEAIARMKRLMQEARA
jgi:pyridoxine 5-phosphate synthase